MYPILPVYFAVSCPPDELGALAVLVNSTCLAVSNGMVCYDGTTAGSVATYTCDNGYMLMGSAERVCGSDGHWDESIPSCEIIGRIVI